MVGYYFKIRARLESRAPGPLRIQEAPTRARPFVMMKELTHEYGGAFVRT
jgi:hypothetical protein